MLLVWIAAGALALGVASGGGLAWKVRGWQVEAVKAKFDGFVTATKAEGEKVAIAELAITKADERRKEQADHEIITTLAYLRTDNQRMRDARSSGSYLPQDSGTAGSPQRITFDRPLLESAIRLLDSEVSGIVEKGDEARVKLDTAKRWAQDPATGMKLATVLK